MKSLYKRQLGTMIGLICLCMCLLGAGFLTLSYQYHINELKKTIERDVTYISNFASSALNKGMALESEQFRSYISSVAMITDATVLLCQPDGRIVYAFGSNLSVKSLAGKSVPDWVIHDLADKQSFSSLTTFSGLLSQKSYVTGVPIITYTYPIRAEVPCGYLFIASDTTSASVFMRDTFQLFFVTAGVVLLISMAICSLTAQRMVQPLKDMAAAAYQFAHGELDTRVADYAVRKDEIGELAKAFNAMSESLAQSERQRSEFVANVSHELKTPMTTIAGFADGILDGTIPPEREKESLAVISSETRRLSRLVRRMLELSRIQSSERLAAQEQFDAGEILLRVLVSLESKVTAKELEIQTDLPDEPVMVWGDPDAVTQVCYNLLDNAIKFSVAGGVLFLRIVTKGGKAYVSVRNQGETIPPDQLSHIFDRFHKADSSRSEHRDGVGLGLYIVKTILNTYRESITVTSQNGFTEFTFTLSEV